MLQASVNNIIHPEDSVIYYPKNAHLISNKYPVYPLRLKEEILKNFPDDTLFFMFFEQPNAISKEMAKEIGFDPKKYETVIDKLLVQISEVRKERLKENYIFGRWYSCIPGHNM